MKYSCICEHCGSVTVVDTDYDGIGLKLHDKAYVSCYGYLITECTKCYAGGRHYYAAAVWCGKDGKDTPRIGSVLN